MKSVGRVSEHGSEPPAAAATAARAFHFPKNSHVPLFFPPTELLLSAAVSHKSQGFLTLEVYSYVLVSASTADNLLFYTTHYIRIL